MAPDFYDGAKVQRIGTHRRECIAGIGNKQASFTDGSVTDRDALNKPRSAHFLCVISIRIDYI